MAVRLYRRHRTTVLRVIGRKSTRADDKNPRRFRTNFGRVASTIEDKKRRTRDPQNESEGKGQEITGRQYRFENIRDSNFDGRNTCVGGRTKKLYICRHEIWAGENNWDEKPCTCRYKSWPGGAR